MKAKDALIVGATIAAGAWAVNHYKPEIFARGARLIESIVKPVGNAIRREIKDFIPLADEEAARTGKYFCKRTEMEDNMPSKAITAKEEDYVSVCIWDNGEFIATKHSTGREITLSEKWFPPDTYHYWMKLLDIRGDVTVTFDGDDKFEMEEEVIKAKDKGGSEKFTVEYECEYEEPCGGDNIRAVFIRPCEKQLFRDGAFANGDLGTRVDGGSLESVCEDLKESEITDVFVAFKVDHEGKGCGDYGELLYDSEKYPQNVSESFRKAFESGIDPIKELMKACNGKGMTFHAWFPVFADRIAAKIAGVSARNEAFGCGGEPMFSEVFADPENEKVVSYLLDLIDEIRVKYYPLAGINLDYIRYPGATDGDIPAYYTVKVNPVAIQNFVIEAEKRARTLSADVFPSESKRIEVGQNGILQYMDMIMPMTYVGLTVDDSDWIAMWVNDIYYSYPLRDIVPLLKGWGTGQDLIEGLSKDVKAAKDGRANGYGIFTYESLLTEQGVYQKLVDVKKIIEPEEEKDGKVH
ncbi:MAG: putative glycoside hydrolase [Candidatus Micrarchaeota archaeon]